MPRNERVELKRGPKQWWLGIVAQVKPGKWAFVYTFDPAYGQLHSRGALGVAPELVEYLRSQGVRAIHAWERGTGCVYVATINTVKDLGVLTLENKVMGPRWHLDKAHWFVTRPDYRRPSWRGWPIVTLYQLAENDPTTGKNLPAYRRPELQPALLDVEG